MLEKNSKKNPLVQHQLTQIKGHCFSVNNQSSHSAAKNADCFCSHKRAADTSRTKVSL